MEYAGAPITVRELTSLVRKAVSYPYFTGKGAPFRAKFFPGKGRLVLVTGGNASGKSLFIRLLSALAKSQKHAEPIVIGVALRTQGGIERAFVWGDERENSTGNNSISAILGGFSTARGREHLTFMAFDEPDIGLSEEYQSVLGNAFAEFVREPPEKVILVISTHSRRVLRPLLECNAHHVRMGDEMSLREVVETVPPYVGGIEKLEELRDLNLSRFRKVCSIMKD